MKTIKRINKHIQFLKTIEAHSSHAYDLITSKLIDEILRILKSEKLVKSDDIPLNPPPQINIPFIPPPLEINVVSAVQKTIDKYLEALRYVLLGIAAGEEATKVVEMMRIKSKIPSGGIIQSYLDSTDTHLGYFKDIYHEIPSLNDSWRKRTLDIIQDRCGRHVDKSIIEMRNKLLNNIDNNLKDMVNTQHAEVRSSIIEKLKAEDLSSQARKKLIRETISEVVKERLPLHQARQILKDSIKDYSTNWNLIVKTETAIASSTASAQVIMEIGGRKSESPVVAIVDKQDDRETEFCLEHSHHENGNWKYFRLTSLKPAGYNLGKKKQEWENSINPRHYNCRCQLVFIPPGFKLNDLGSLVPLGKDEEIKIEY